MAAHTDQVLESFDNIADFYDGEVENDVTQRLRTQIYERVGGLVPAGSSVLDINCGTGIDAIALAGRGYKVSGIDLSPKMIERARQKADRQGVPASFQVSSFENLESVAESAFDLMLSNFGGLNCVQRLDRVAQQAASRLRPGGFLVCVVMPRVCLWETVTGLARLQFRAAFRRLSKNVEATGFRGKTFSVYYHSPARFAHAFRPWFEVRDIRGWNIVSPPPHAAPVAKRHPVLGSMLERVDAAIERLPVCRSIGDHYVMTLRRLA
jgi:ubiquinone/menaquinone biosynthesis C-methylase UbiE